MKVGEPTDELHRAGFCCGACQHGAEAVAGSGCAHNKLHLDRPRDGEPWGLLKIRGTAEREVPLVASLVTVGRSERDADVVLQSNKLSRKRFTLSLRDGGV